MPSFLDVGTLRGLNLVSDPSFASQVISGNPKVEQDLPESTACGGKDTPGGDLIHYRLFYTDIRNPVDDDASPPGASINARLGSNNSVGCDRSGDLPATGQRRRNVPYPPLQPQSKQKISSRAVAEDLLCQAQASPACETRLLLSRNMLTMADLYKRHKPFPLHTTPG
jgi:hypothetical protein